MTSQSNLIGSTPIDPSLGTTITGAIDTLKSGSVTSVTETINWVSSWDNHTYKSINRLNTNWRELYTFIDLGQLGFSSSSELQFNVTRTDSNCYAEYSTYNMSFAGGGSWQLALYILLDTSSSSYNEFKLNPYSVLFIGYNSKNGDGYAAGLKLKSIRFIY